MDWGISMADQELAQWTELARSITDADRERHAPPAHVWNNIEAALANDFDATFQPTDFDHPDELTIVEPSEEVVPPEDVIDLAAARETLAPSARRQSMRRLVLAGAASVLAIVLGVSLLSGDSEPAPTFVADITNANLTEAFDGTAMVTVEGTQMDISFDGELPTDEPVELWVIKPDLSAMRSLGIVEPGDSEWTWPEDLDPTEYSIVDLSIEPNDGNPAHSGRSFLQGQLTLT